MVRNCSAWPNWIGTTLPSITTAAAELLVPKSMPSFMLGAGAVVGGRALCGNGTADARAAGNGRLH
ncbi:hypothetical protein D3C71_1664340 [compost metagenome]